MNSTPGHLIEHFFRHEYVNLVAVLTRAFGVRRLDLVEDTVQAAMLQAVNVWKQRGVPKNPAAWIHRVAKNEVLDALRRDKIHRQALAHAHVAREQASAVVDEWLEQDSLPDSLLRMVFVCCHPGLVREAQLALALKVLCGFGTTEVARALLTTTAAAKKRIQRARARLAELNPPMELPDKADRAARLDAVHQVLYLMFNEGYATSRGHDPIRADLCEEAARLCHMICVSEFGTPASRALLALMLFHSARLDSRIDEEGDPVLLSEQDRSLWDSELIRLGEHWLSRAAGGARTRYHFEAGIAMLHCKAESVGATDWQTVVRLYDSLTRIQASPLYVLNRAIARAEAGDVDLAHAELRQLAESGGLKDYLLLDAARARLFEIRGQTREAIDCYLQGLSRSPAPHERALLEKQLARLRGELTDR